MKRFLICALFMLLLAACADGSSLYQHNCSEGGEVCIEVSVDESISFGEPVNVSIKVTSEKDISRLGVTLYHDADVEVERPQGWEKDLQDVTIYKGGASWEIAVTASNSAIFTWKLYLPPRGGNFRIGAQAFTPELFAEDMIRIYMTTEGGKVYHSGTPIPITEGPVPLFTGPSPTFEPTRTHLIFPTAISTTEAPPLEVLGTPAYPPPGTPYP